MEFAKHGSFLVNDMYLVYQIFSSSNSSSFAALPIAFLGINRISYAVQLLRKLFKVNKDVEKTTVV